MDTPMQMFGNQLNYVLPKICHTQDILLTNLSFTDPCHTTRFQQLRSDLADEGKESSEREHAGKNLIELLSFLPLEHLAQVVVRLEVARALFDGQRYCNVVIHCEEALRFLADQRAFIDESGTRYDSRLRFDLIELCAAAHEFDGDDAAALQSWEQLPSAAAAAITESSVSRTGDKTSHIEFVDDTVMLLTDAWFSAKLSVPKKLEELRSRVVGALLDSVLDALNSLLPVPITTDQLPTLRVTGELTIVASRVLHLFALHAAKEKAYLAAEALLTKRWEMLQVFSLSDPFSDERSLWSDAFLDVLRNQTDRGAVGRATELAKDLLEIIDTFPPKKLELGLSSIQNLIARSQDDDFYILRPLVVESFQRSPLPQAWAGVICDVIERSLDLAEMKKSRELMAVLDQKIGVLEDPNIPISVKASLCFSQLRVLIKIENDPDQQKQIPKLARSRLNLLLKLLETGKKSFDGRPFFLFMAGGLEIFALCQAGKTAQGLALGLRILKASEDDPLDRDPSALDALLWFGQHLMKLDVFSRDERLARSKSLFYAISRALSRRAQPYHRIPLELLTAAGNDLAEYGKECLELIPEFTELSQSITKRMYTRLPAVLVRIDEGELSDSLLLVKINLLSSQKEVMRLLGMGEGAEFAEISARLESARSAARLRDLRDER